jgi:hypothetical protein
MQPELGLRGMVVFVDQSRDDRLSADESQLGHVPDGLRLDFRGPLLPGLARPVAVVMGHVLPGHQARVAVTGDQGPVQQSAAEGPDDALLGGLVNEYQPCTGRKPCCCC